VFSDCSERFVGKLDRGEGAFDAKSCLRVARDTAIAVRYALGGLQNQVDRMKNAARTCSRPPSYTACSSPLLAAVPVRRRSMMFVSGSSSANAPSNPTVGRVPPTGACRCAMARTARSAILVAVLTAKGVLSQPMVSRSQTSPEGSLKTTITVTVRGLGDYLTAEKIANTKFVLYLQAEAFADLAVSVQPALVSG
jgi:hypothetical protein